MAISVEIINDENVPTRKLASPTGVNEMRQKVANYNNYMVAQTGLPSDQVFDAFTVDMATINQLLVDNSSDAIRVYLIKETDSVADSSGITFLIVAAKKIQESPAPEYIDSLFDVTGVNEMGKVYKIECPTPACPPANTNSYILF